MADNESRAEKKSTKENLHFLARLEPHSGKKIDEGRSTFFLRVSSRDSADLK